MVYEHNRIIFEGSLGTAETWSAGFSVQGEDGSFVSGPEVLLEWATACLEQFGDPGLYPALKTLLSSQAKVTAVRITAIQNDGTTFATGLADGGNIAGSNGQTMPYQVAACISLKTNLSGASRRGRLYWPALGASISTNRLQTPTDEATIAGNMRDLIKDCCLAGPPGPDSVPVIASRVLNDVTTVTSVGCGDILDTQRRRRDGLLETYSFSPFPG